MSNIKFLGAVNTVTGSKFVITNNEDKILVDCGMYQGKKDDAYLQNKDFEENIPEVDFCILSHAHIDHSGMLPTLIKNKFIHRIFSTPATHELCKHMLKDSAKVYEKELPIISKMLRKRRINHNISAFYDENDVNECLCKFSHVDYDNEYGISKNTRFTFHDSCHILGSASVKLSLTDNGITNKVWYSSDLGHNRSLLAEEPKIPQDINYLIIESTYGNKQREEEDVSQKLLKYINDAYKRGGRILIPAFSVGRMQTIILIVHKLHLMGLIPNIPIYVDSPLGVKVTKLYEKYMDDLNQHNLEFFTDNGIHPFEDSMIKYITEMKDSLEISTSDEQCIIISASGMCEGGHVREHIKTVSGDKNSSIVFVGYNAENTLGRRLQENNGQVNIDGKQYRVRCKVESIGGLSAHADLNYLVNYVERVVAGNAIKKIFLIHGDVDAIKNFKHTLNSKGIDNVIIPELNKEYNL